MQVKKLSINQAVGKLTASQDNTAEIYSVGNSIGIRYYDSDYDSLRNNIIQECLNFDQQGKMTRINNLWVNLEQPSQWQVLCGQGPQIRIHTVYFKKEA